MCGIIVGMKKILLILLLLFTATNYCYGEKYMIYWNGDPDITSYSIEQTNIESGVGTMKRFGVIVGGTQEYPVNLLNGLTYTIKIIGYDNFGNQSISNVLTIKTKKDKPDPVMKPLIIKARKVLEGAPDESITINLPSGKKRRN